MTTEHGPVRAAFAAQKYKIYGILFIVVVFFLLALSVLIYNRSLWYQRSTPIYLNVSSAGEQLNKDADVKIHGLIIGRVASQKLVDDHVMLKLAINKGQLKKIPSNVEARILPKTLFGEKYVDLVIPPGATSAASIHRNAVIGEDRSQAALELGQVFDNLVPLLTAVQPAQLNSTLNALATALENRGDQLGQDLGNFDQYLKGFNQNLPTLQQDIGLFADFNKTFADAAPYLTDYLRASATTSQTIVERQQAILDFLRGSAGFADTASSLFRTNEQRLIYLSKSSVPILTAIKQFGSSYYASSPERQIPLLRHDIYSLDQFFQGGILTLGPCPASLNNTQADACPAGGKPGGMLNVILSEAPDRGTYTNADCPRYPNPDAPNAQNPPLVSPEPKGPPEASGPNCPGAAATPAAASAVGVAPGAIGPVGSPNEKTLVGELLGALSPSSVSATSSNSDLADLLIGPVLRGSAVDVR